jgi:hypothetical protein
MRMTRAAAVALPAAAVLAAGVPLAANAVSTHQTTSAHQTTPQPPADTVAVYNCLNKPQVRPTSFDVFCDGSNYLTKLNWSTWTLTEATGTGVEWADNCSPNCAQGKWTPSNVIVVLWRAEPVSGHNGQFGYSKMTFLYPALAQTQTLTPPGAY